MPRPPATQGRDAPGPAPPPPPARSRCLPPPLRQRLVEAVVAREEGVARLVLHGGHLREVTGPRSEADRPGRGRREGLRDQLAREVLGGHRIVLRRVRRLPDPFVEAPVSRVRGAIALD